VTPVRVERSEAGWWVTPDHPDHLNPLSDATCADLHAVVKEVADETATRVVVIGGAGRAFSAGADLRSGGATAPAEWAARRRGSGRWNRLLDDIEALPQVTVARLHGWVIGGAVLLAMACDLRVGSDDTRFRIPEVPLGIPLTWGGLPRLAREVGLPRTRELVMTGRVVEANEALEWGLLTRMAAAGDIDVATRVLVDELLGMPTVPLTLTKEAIHAIGRATGALAVSWSDADVLSWSVREPETADAMRAYMRKNLSQDT